MEAARYSQEPATEKGRRRRDLIIRSATRLFDEQGFHATGIDEIGEASGITGPGVYRHFAGKDEILIAVFDRIWMMLRVGLDDAEGRRPEDALSVLIDQHVRFAVDHRAEMALLVRQLGNLPAEYQAKARANRDRYERAWVEPLSRLRGDLSDGECWLTVRATTWMINAYAFDRHRSDPDPGIARVLLTDMAGRVLGL